MRVKGMAALHDFDYFVDHGNGQEGFEGKLCMLRVSNSLHSDVNSLRFLGFFYCNRNIFENQELLERQCSHL